MERKVIGIPNWTRVVMDIKDGRLVGWLRARGKYRNMSTIYCVSEGIDTILHGEISVRRYFGRNLQKSAISHDISAINCRFFPIYHLVNALQCLKNLLLLRGFEPQTKRFGVQPIYHLSKLTLDI